MRDIRKLCYDISKKHNSFYLYDENVVRRNAKRLKDNFPGVKFVYSVKANPHPDILKTVVREGFGVDAASLREVEMGERLGLRQDMIYYSAPGKSDDDMASCLNKSYVTADSLGELVRLEKISADMKIKSEVAVRINPDFTMDSDTGVSSKFGIDEELFLENIEKIKAMSHISIAGIHVHSRSQELSSRVLEKYYENMLALLFRLENALERKLRFVNMGGGLGIPYAPGDKELNTRLLGEKVSELTKKFSADLGGTEIVIETGRYICGNAGVYVSKVMDKKVSRGKTYLILCNTLNGFMRPSIARLVEKTGNPYTAEPLYTKKDAIPFYIYPERPGEEKVTVCGNLCTRTDEVARNVTLPIAEVGDIVIMGNAGSYAAVLSPCQFRSLEKPLQVFLRSDGSIDTM